MAILHNLDLARFKRELEHGLSRGALSFVRVGRFHYFSQAQPDLFLAFV